MEAVGPAVSIPVSILETFKLFFTAALVTTMVEQTNLYAVQVLRDKTETSWTNVTEGDIYVFLGIAVLMGVNQLHALAHYWWKNPIFHYSPIATGSVETGSLPLGSSSNVQTTPHNLTTQIRSMIDCSRFVWSSVQ